MAISWEDFLAVDLRVGSIVSAEINGKAREPAYVIKVDLGPLGIKQSSAKLTKFYGPADLVGRQVVCVVNFAPKNIAGVVSEVLITGVYDGGRKDDVVLLSAERKVENGRRVG